MKNNIFAILSFAFFCLGACKKDKKVADKFIISYEMNCTDATVTYSVDETNTSSEYHQKTGWTKSFEAKKGQTIHLIVYNTSSNPQGVGATIKLNGQVIKQGTNYCPISGYTWLVVEHLGE